MTFDELEFAISQYLDGSLPAEQVAALEARLEVDGAARQLLEEYRRLDDALKRSAGAAPELQWGRLAEHLSDVVSMEAERLEQVAVEYVDGALPAAEMVEFEARVSEDGRARDLVEQHRRLRGALKALPRPVIHWEKLAGHLYAACVGEPQTIKLSAYRWMRAAGGLAVAACVMIVSALGLRHHLHPAGSGLAGASHGQSFAIVEVEGVDDAAATAVNHGVVEVSIGAGAEPVADAGGSEFAGIVTAAAPRSLVANNAPVAQDGLQMPY